MARRVTLSDGRQVLADPPRTEVQDRNRSLSMYFFCGPHRLSGPRRVRFVDDYAPAFITQRTLVIATLDIGERSPSTATISAI